jgi:hypothetical protein
MYVYVLGCIHSIGCAPITKKMYTDVYKDIDVCDCSVCICIYGQKLCIYKIDVYIQIIIMYLERYMYI